MDNEWKDIWQKASDAVPETPPIAVDLTKAPLTIVERLRRTIYWENRFNQAFTVLLPCWFLVEKEYIFAIGTILFMIPFLYYYHRLLKKLADADLDTNVYSYLKKSYQTLKTFINHYKWSGWFLAIIGLALGVTIKDPKYTLFHHNLHAQSVLTIVITFALTIVMVYGIIYLMYGKKFKKLEELVKSMEEE